MIAPPRRLRARAQPLSLPLDARITRYCAFIRTLPCLACGKPAPSECASVGMPARMGLPTGERYLVPLCGPASVWDDCCHSQKHFLGAARFWSALALNPADLAVRLWRVSGDMEAGEREVRRARQAAAAVARHGINGSRTSSVNRVARSGRQSSPQDQRILDGQSTASLGLVLAPRAGP